MNHSLGIQNVDIPAPTNPIKQLQMQCRDQQGTPIAVLASGKASNATTRPSEPISLHRSQLDIKVSDLEASLQTEDPVERATLPSVGSLRLKISAPRDRVTCTSPIGKQKHISTMGATTCVAGADSQFGPRVDTGCRAFDFTLYFEDVFFSCLPASVFLTLLPPYIATLLRRRVSSRSWSTLLFAKQAALFGVFAAQLAFLVLRAIQEDIRTSASLAADLLHLISILGAMVLSFLDHQRSLRPSTLLSLYLSTVVLLDIARVRTLWQMGSGTGSSAAALSTTLALATVSLLVESVEKHRGVSSEKSEHSPEQLSGFWNRTSFIWLVATFRAGYLKIISIDDLPVLDTNLRSQIVGAQLEATWAKYNPRKKHSLIQASFRAFMPSFLSPIIPRLCLTAFTFSQPFLINATVSFVSDPQAQASHGRGLIGAWALTLLGIGVSTAVFHYQNFRFVTRLRGGLIALVYERSLRTRTVDAGGITSVALVGTDVERIAQSSMSVHEVWSCLVDIPIGIWLLEREMSVACVAPIILLLLFIGIMYHFTAATKESQVAWVEKVQERLKVTTSMLSDMKAVKMLGLSQVMSSIIQGYRVKEVETSRRFRKLLVTRLLLSNTPINLAPVVTFAAYVIIALYWKNETLLTAQAFTAVALISLLTTPVLVFIQMFPFVLQSVGCFGRVQDFCNYSEPVDGSTTAEKCDNTDSESIKGSAIELNLLSTSEGLSRDAMNSGLSFTGQSFGWDKSKSPYLKDVKVEIHPGKFTAIIGPVGSGKTTFMESILGESIATPSVLGRPSKSIAYCAQEPWIENGTIRANIIGVSAYNRQWYDIVTSACDLTPDLAELEIGDQTKVGSKGLNLSGGQKQRIALARAVYSRSPLILLDDVFSGMDARTVDHVSWELLGQGGLLRNGLVTVILATHNLKLMAMAEGIIAFAEGRIVETGSPADLLKADGYVKQLNLDVDTSDTTERRRRTEAAPKEQRALRESLGQSEAAESAVQDSRRKQGGALVYKYYFKSSGYIIVSWAVLFMTAWVFCSEFPTVWLKWWAEANTANPNENVGMYIGIFSMFGLLGSVFVSIAAWLIFINIISSTALSMHSDLLETTLRAPMRFFYTTDTGTLTNRFSQDFELIDMNLPIYMVNYISAAFGCAAKVIIVAVFSRYLAVAVPFIGILVFFLQKFYLKTSRQVRLLEIEAKAPLFTHLLESKAGASTIRAFGWQAEYRLRNHRHTDVSQQPAYLQYCIQQCLAFVLDLIVTVLTVILVAVTVVWKDRFDAGSVGVSLVTIVTFSQRLARLITMWTMMESSIGAVSRVQQFVAETESEETSDRFYVPPEEWPQEGAIEIQDLVASHGLDAPPVIKGISLSIKPGEHIAVCGRSGSGKSSLMLSLLQMIDIQAGQIVIDGVKLGTMARASLRSCLNAVPQEPFLMPGTIRFNIDPFKKAEDEEVTEALQRVKLWSAVIEQGGLDEEINTEAWSVGQKQLLCLARAMVRKSQVLILDEAMSSVDSETESIMQEIIDVEFKHCTVLAIMHRLRHISKYDKIALLDNGSLLEYDSPAALLAIESSFAELHKAGGGH